MGRLIQNDVVAVPCWLFDAKDATPSERWSAQTFGSKWRTTRMTGVVKSHAPGNMWRILFTYVDLEGKQHTTTDIIRRKDITFVERPEKPEIGEKAQKLVLGRPFPNPLLGFW